MAQPTAIGYKPTLAVLFVPSAHMSTKFLVPTVRTEKLGETTLRAIGVLLVPTVLTVRTEKLGGTTLRASGVFSAHRINCAHREARRDNTEGQWVCEAIAKQHACTIFTQADLFNKLDGVGPVDNRPSTD